jgi:hypothetical protein
MECGYCGLCSPINPIYNKKIHYCDESCRLAYWRQRTTAEVKDEVEFLQGHISIFKSAIPDKGDEKLLATSLKATQLRYLFNKGLLQRQTKAQLRLLQSKIVEVQQAIFLIVDESRERYTDGQLLDHAALFSKDCQDWYRALIDIWGR